MSVDRARFECAAVVGQPADGLRCGQACARPPYCDPCRSVIYAPETADERRRFFRNAMRAAQR